MNSGRHLEEGVQVAAGEVLHDEVELLRRLKRIVHLDHERVVRRRQDVALRPDVLHLPGLDARLVQCLDGVDVAGLDLLGQEHATVRALRDGLDDLEILENGFQGRSVGKAPQARLP